VRDSESFPEFLCESIELESARVVPPESLDPASFVLHDPVESFLELLLVLLFI